METTLPPPRAKSALLDPSLFGIIAGNLLSMILAVAQRWSAADVMWIYWWQSVTIGATNFVRIWNLKDFTTKGLTSNGKPVPETRAAARSTAVFFAFHYGFFHFVYAVFLSTISHPAIEPRPALSAALAAFAVAGLAASHVFSLRHNAARDFRDKKPNLGTLMFYPYIRILPMHLAIIFGGAVAGLALPVFMTLKTVADCGMHIIEHRIYQARGG